MPIPSDILKQAPVASRTALDNALDTLKDKHKVFNAAKKGISGKVKEAEKNTLGKPLDFTLPLLNTFVVNRKGAGLGVEGSFTFKPSLIKGIKALNEENPENPAYKALAMQIKEDLEDKQQTMELTPAEQLFMDMIANPDLVVTDRDTDVSAAKEDVNKAKEAAKEARERYKIDRKAFDSVVNEWRRKHKGRTLQIHEGPNKIGLSVSGGGANASYILKVVEQDGKKWLKGYKAITNNADTGDWLHDHTTVGIDDLDSIGKGYPANTPEEFNEAFKHWINAALGNTKQLESGHNGKYDRMKAAEKTTYAKEFDGKNAIEVFKARVADLAKQGAQRMPDFQSMLKNWHGLGLEIDKNTYDMYLPENTPENFEPIKFLTKEQKDAARLERINAQGKKIFEEAHAGHKGYSIDEKGRAVKTLKPQEKRVTMGKGGRVTLETKNPKGEWKGHQMMGASEGQVDWADTEKTKRAEEKQLADYTDKNKNVESTLSKLGLNPALFGV